MDIAAPNPQLSYAGVLGNKTQTKQRVQLLSRGYDIVDGKATMIFTKEEHDLLANTCRWTIIGKFHKTRPSIEKIRAEFPKIIKNKDAVKIGAKDRYHVFIDMENEEDYNIIYSKPVINFNEGNNMKILKWTTNFRPDTETTLAPVWINLPNLSWHYYEWDALYRIVQPMGTPLFMDKATASKTRPTTTKLRVEIDLERPLLHEISVEIRNKEGQLEKFIPKIEYETIPVFFSHCKVQGHSISSCRIQTLRLILEPKRKGDVNWEKLVTTPFEKKCGRFSKEEPLMRSSTSPKLLQRRKLFQFTQKSMKDGRKLQGKD